MLNDIMQIFLGIIFCAFLLGMLIGVIIGYKIGGMQERLKS